MYNVLIHFHDLKDVDKNTKSGPIYHEYSVGDTYPREGLKPSQERIDELSGGNNAFGAPIIEAADKAVDADGEPPASSDDDQTSEPPADGEDDTEEPSDKSGGKKASK